MVVACFWCNSSRGSFDFHEWRDVLQRMSYEGEADLKRQAALARLDESVPEAQEITQRLA